MIYLKVYLEIFDSMKFLNILLLAVVVTMISGCDFFRILAGRPTSADIEAKKVEIENFEQERAKAREDSIAQVRAKHLRDSIARADSLAILDMIVQQTGPVLTPEKFRGLAKGELSAKFYVVVGVFRSPANAKNFQNKVDARGYQTTLFSFNNGIHAIGVNPTNRISEAHQTLKLVNQDVFFPKGSWVLMNE